MATQRTTTRTSRKPRTTRKPRKRATAASQAAAPRITPDERRAMIAEAAYLRAEARGFQGGDPVEDWLIAEREIDRRLAELAEGAPQ
ncbi:MAG: DUF2934 domain-containing protein [Gammaproteobacteria bacterium]|nr:MAG: DUF2934 domain-containing protein [Gammaproteobacteria bacterium]